MSEVRFYKITLELKTKLNNSGISFLSKFNDVVAAKNSFNSAMQGSKYLVILSLTQFTVNLLIRLDRHSAKRSIGLRTIGRLVSILLNDLNWKSYFGSNASAAFKVTSTKVLDTGECRTVVNTLYSEDNEYLASSDIKKLFENLEENSGNEVNAGNEIPLTKSLEDCLAKISEMPGAACFKKEIDSIVKFVEINRQLVSNGNIAAVFPYHYLFRGDMGVNHVMPAKLMTEVFFHLGLIKQRKFARLNVPDECSEYSGVSFDGCVDETETGVVFVENIFGCKDANVSINKILAKITEKMLQLKGRIILILSYYNKEDKGFTFRLLENALNKAVNCRQIEFPYYSNSEIYELIKKSAETRGCRISDDVAEVIAGEAIASKGVKGFDTGKAVDNAIERAYADKLLNLKDLDDSGIAGLPVLSCDDFNFFKLSTGAVTEKADNAPMNELQDMIGLDDVKNRVRQIHSLLTVSLRKKELGINYRPVCLHMQFTGNPGTGKTTVARILGRILRNMGILNSGHFIELTRNDLIGEYIGQTTPKVKRALKKAKGGIMFIDEAYSLCQSAESDYGNEAIAELLKGMEDYKDDMVVIFAGYPNEMEKMMGMNPGLRDRVAFKIEFPDYSVEELISIFHKMCSENSYSMTQEATDKMHELIKSLYAGKGENFSNARIIRKIFERAEIIQNCRICSENVFCRDKLTVIALDDVMKLYEDIEIANMLKSASGKSKIGFKSA